MSSERAPKPESESHDRVTVSSVPISRESRVSDKHRIDIEAAWLDRLLVAACEMPSDEGETAVVEFLVRALGEIFPDCGVGACLVPVPSQLQSALQVGAPVEQQLFKYVPEGAERRGYGVDPTRLFPGFAFERVLEVGPTGSTLHIATDDPQVEDDESPMIHVARRGALALSRGLLVARGHAKATSDARDLRALHSHMVQAEKLASVGQIAAGVVHELNNPLTSIVAYTDWLRRKHGPDGDPDIVERLRRINESASRILRFTRDLVAYARPSSEVFAQVSLHNVIEQGIAFCEHVIADHGAVVDRKYALGVPTVYGMSEQLVQVFVNILTNACHALPPQGGRLLVGSEMSPLGMHVIAFVEDNGHGIAPEHVSQIFAPFFTTKVDGRGTGLGLSIVKNILDNHGADIRVERAPSGGARFLLSFPIAE